MSHRTTRMMFWVPRILAIIYILFISVFAFDVWEMPGGFWQKLGGFLIHLLPSYAVLAVLLLAWVRPKLGGIGFILLAVAFALLFGWRDIYTLLLLAAPLVLIGSLFLMEWWMGNARLEPQP